MAETQTNDYLSQLRSINEHRGKLGHLAAIGTHDLRTASIVHEYKPFSNHFNNISNKGHNHPGISNISLGIAPMHHHNNITLSSVDHGHGNSGNATNSGASNNNPAVTGTTSSSATTTNQNHQAHQLVELKQSYSPPSTPHSPTTSEVQDTKLFGHKQNMMIQSQHLQNQQQQLQNQILNVRDTKPYKCTSCLKTFANSSYLSQHTRIHLGIKPYRCDICQRKFTQLSHLQQHIRTHTGDKPYKCRHLGCPKAFSQLSNLQSHSRCHASDKPFKCNSCYKCFTDEQTLLEHIPRHKDSKHLKTHICNLCGKSYTQETYLEKHLQKHAEKAEKQQARNQHNSSIVQHHNIVSGAGIYNLNRNTIAMNVAAVVAGEHPWTKVGTNVAAVTLAEAIQQQHQQQQQQQQQSHNGYDFSSSEQHQPSETSASISNNSNEDNVGEDLRQNHHQSNNTTNTIVVVSSETAQNSAFTPINTVASHITASQLPPRPYIYDALNFQAATAKNTAGTVTTAAATAVNFPNQLISLHQIRNYTHQPEAGIVGLPTTNSNNNKDNKNHQ